MDHDRLFKELLTTFFREFIEAFLPQVAAYLDPDAPIEFLDKEVYTDLTAGDKHEVDLIAKVRFRGADAFFLIHVENQAKAQSHFPKRMFIYFSRLHEKYDLPVYPVVIFSYDAPKRAEPHQYVMAFPDETVLQFKYRAIQLNHLPWRRFLKQPNPAATALMTKMHIASNDRVKVRCECLRLLITLKLDAAKSELIWRFVEAYLKLNAQETRQYERAVAKLTPEEQETAMEMMTSWRSEGWTQGRQEGRAEGRQEGKEELVTRLIRRRFGAVSARVTEQLDHLSSEQLDELGEALLDFTTPADLETWLARNPA